LAALKPGIAPTTRPKKMAGIITHQKLKVRTNISLKKERSYSILE